MRVSHETVYRSIFLPRLRAVDRALFRKLRSGRPTRYPRKFRNSSARGRIKNMVSVRDRPATPVERTSRFTVGEHPCRQRGWSTDP